MELLKIDISGLIIKTEKVIQMHVVEIYKKRKEPYPNKIELTEDHKVAYFESKYYLSLYPTIA